MEREIQRIVIGGGLVIGMLLMTLIWLLQYEPVPGVILEKEDAPEVPETTIPPASEEVAYPQETPDPGVSLVSAFDKSIMTLYHGLDLFTGTITLEDNHALKAPEELGEHYFSAYNRTIKEIATEKTSGLDSYEGMIGNLINHVRTKRNDRNHLMAGLLFNAGFTNVTIVKALCDADPLRGTQIFTVLYHDGREYYLDMENDIWDPLDHVTTPDKYTRICDDTLEVITPTMILRKDNTN